MRKQIMYLLLFGWLLTPLSAWADSNVKFLCIQLRDGTTAEFALADHPVITLTGGTMKAETAKKTITASLADIVRYTFKEEGGTTDISNDPQTQPSQPQSIFEEGHVRFTNLPARASISVITIDGRQVLRYRPLSTATRHLYHPDSHYQDQGLQQVITQRFNHHKSTKPFTQ